MEPLLAALAPLLSPLDPGVAPGMRLAGLFVASLLAATLLPGGSELVLAGLLARDPALWPAALPIATLGNTLGGLSTYALARLLPHRAHTGRLGWVERHGSPILILSWAPLIGDALCAAAGWLRLPWLPCLGWIALGKFLRYVVVALPFVVA